LDHYIHILVGISGRIGQGRWLSQSKLIREFAPDPMAVLNGLIEPVGATLTISQRVIALMPQELAESAGGDRKLAIGLLQPLVL
jgi:hypothetical protein